MVNIGALAGVGRLAASDALPDRHARRLSHGPNTPRPTSPRPCRACGRNAGRVPARHPGLATATWFRSCIALRHIPAPRLGITVSTREAAGVPREHPASGRDPDVRRACPPPWAATRTETGDEDNVGQFDISDARAAWTRCAPCIAQPTVTSPCSRTGIPYSKPRWRRGPHERSRARAWPPIPGRG